MPVKPLNIYSYFNKARFTQAGAMDCANWYNTELPDGKSDQALYPTMGRRHFEYDHEVKLLFTSEPRAIFRSINFIYVVVGTRVFQVDKFYQLTELDMAVELEGILDFDWLAVTTTIYCMLTDGKSVFVITESQTVPVSVEKSIGDTPENPTFVAAFGNRFIVSSKDSPIFNLTQINLGGVPLAANNTWFTIPVDGALFAQATGLIRQIGILHNQMYIFTDFTTDIWSNIPTQLEVGGEIKTFPFKQSSSYNWDFGIADYQSLSIDFGIMTWLAQNESGLVTFMFSDGQQPKSISTQPINVLLETQVQTNGLSPFLSQSAVGFLYQWENTIFYRVIAGKNLDFGNLEIEDSSNAIEYNFNTKKWHRVIELNGTRNLIYKHVYFNNKHFVIVKTQKAIFEMRGDLYTNELESTTTPGTFTKEPMRYELITAQIYEPDYSEFVTKYLEIDFVFGNMTLPRSNTPFQNTVYLTDENGNFIVSEESTSGTETFLIQEGTNTPTTDDTHYNYLFNPHIELYFSNDGGMTFQSADIREFSALGVYQWRMRWYELGASRNRCYKLICVSGFPIVILSASHNIIRASGGAN